MSVSAEMLSVYSAASIDLAENLEEGKVNSYWLLDDKRFSIFLTCCK